MDQRSHTADVDTDVPRHPQRHSTPDWKASLSQVRDSITRDHLTIVAPGVAFYFLLGLIPALAALISIYAFIADPQQIQEHFGQLQGAMPEDAQQLLMSQMERIAEEQTAAGWGALISLALALWAGSQATAALMEGLNITYDTEETRGFLKRTAVRLGLTLAAVVLGIIALLMIAVVPPMLAALPFGDALETVLSVLRWPLLLLIGAFAIALFYRYAPDRRQPPVRWLSWGAVAAAVLWVVASILFSVYVANFGSYNETYGTLGALVILLLWLLITAFVILLGAELDEAFEAREREHAGAASDGRRGDGRRGARAAS